MGDNIQRLADKTSLSIEQVQRLSYVAMQSGVSMDGMVSAVQNLQQRLGSNDAGAVGAMKALGINVESFLALNPYDQFTTIAEAVGKIEDPTARASIQAAIFGKNWKEIAPVIIANIKQLAAEAPVMGDNTTRALAQMDDSLKKFQLTVRVWAAEAVQLFRPRDGHAGRRDLSLGRRSGRRDGACRGTGGEDSRRVEGVRRSH